MTSEYPSVTQEPAKALAYLLVSQALAALESLLAAPHSVREALPLLEVPSQNILQQFVGIPALPCLAAERVSLDSRSGGKWTSIVCSFLSRLPLSKPVHQLLFQ